MQPKNKECYCGNDFAPKTANHKYCSRKCERTAANMRRHRTKPVTFVCKYCKCESQGILYRKFCSNQCKNDWNKQQKRLFNEQKHNHNPVKCKNCNEEFMPYRDGQIWCSSECKMENFKKGQKETRAARRKQAKKTCPVCDKEFFPKRSMRQKYCSPYCRNLFAKKAYKALQTCLKCTNQQKQDRASKLLGYTPRELQEHIQKHPNWNNVKSCDWHLDHIFPIIAFIEHGLKDIDLMCCLDNLQPLLGKDNCSKNRTYDQDEFKEWLTKKRSKNIMNCIIVHPVSI